MEQIATPVGFMVLLSLFVLGGVGALIGRKFDRFANLWGSMLAVAGSVWGLAFASSVLVSGDVNLQYAASSLPLLPISLHIDKLAAFFVFAISLVALFCSLYAVGYVKSYYKRYSIGSLSFFYNLFIAAMLLVVTASNAILFLIAWEIMALVSYCLVVYDRHDEANVKAGYIYLVMTHVGTAFIILAFMLLYGYTNSFDFGMIKAGAGSVPQLAKDAIFALAFIGLGTKAGVIPFHIWLPSAHPAAPSHVSALMSGVMIKTGIYMMIRLFLDMMGPLPVWWGLAVLIMGSASCVLGVLYAITEHDIKRLLAFHSIENIGIILLGLGSAMVFSSMHQPALMLLALAAALFHTLNHAVFKSLLFLGAGSVIHATHTRNIEEYGGLIKLMPVTALMFLVGSMAISALPPFNGFASEWITFQSLFHGAATAGPVGTWVFVLAIAALGLTGGLALACFVKAFGATFLARPRSDEARHAHESSWWMRLGMVGLGTLCLVLGVASAPITQALQSIGQSITGAVETATRVSALQTLHVGSNYAAVSSAMLFGLLLIVPMGVWLVVKYGVYRQQKESLALTWDCGTSLNERMEITSTGFARSIVMIFQGVLRPTMQKRLEYSSTAASRYLPKSREVTLTVGDLYRKYTYNPLYAFALAVSNRAKVIQNGSVNSYVLYIFAILVITLMVAV